MKSLKKKLGIKFYNNYQKFYKKIHIIKIEFYGKFLKIIVYYLIL